MIEISHQFLIKFSLTKHSYLLDVSNLFYYFVQVSLIVNRRESLLHMIYCIICTVRVPQGGNAYPRPSLHRLPPSPSLCSSNVTCDVVNYRSSRMYQIDNT